MEVRIINSVNAKEWDALVEHPVQSYDWGEARKKLGTQLIRLGVYEGEKLQEVFQMTLHKLPVVNKFIGYIPRSKIPREEVLVFLREYAKKHSIIFIKFEPIPNEGQTFPKELTQSRHALFYSATRVIDLTQSLEEIKKSCAKKTRYNIGLAERSGVQVRELSNKEGFEIFAQLFFDTAARKNYGGHTRYYHKTVWETLSEKGIAKILVAFIGDTPLAVYELFLFKNVLYSPYSGGSSLHPELKAKNLLLWEVIKFGKDHGALVFDMWGVAFTGEKRARDWDGFSEFKKGYGGSLVTFPGSYDLVVSPLWYLLYSFLYDLRKMTKKSR